MYLEFQWPFIGQDDFSSDATATYQEKLVLFSLYLHLNGSVHINALIFLSTKCHIWKYFALFV